MNRQNNAGFTLLELMIVVAIVGIVAAFAVPSYQNMIERNRLKQAAGSLLSDMQHARTEAIKRSQDIFVSRTTGNNGAWCYGVSTAACNCAATPSTCTLKTISGAGFPQTNLSSPNGNSTFSSRRGTIGANGVTFSTTNYVVRVVFSNVGRVRLCTPAVGTLNRPAGTDGLLGVDAC